MTDFGLNSVTTVKDMVIYHRSAQRNVKTPAVPFVLRVMSPNHAKMEIILNVSTAQEIPLGLVIITHLVLIALLWSNNATK